MNLRKIKKAQEEMIGFALIVVVISVILLIFLRFSLTNNEREAVESYEVESFIQSSLQYTTECKDNFEYLSIQDVIYECRDGITCVNGENPCTILSSDLKGITEKGWKTGTDSPVKGYSLVINSLNESLIEISDGNLTGNSKGSSQFLPNGIEIRFVAYY